jgi:UDP-glucose 4-epimerase
VNILISGGAGYIGTSLIELLSTHKKVEQIIIYDNLSRGNRNLFIGRKKLEGKIRFIQGDILDSRKFKKVVAEADTVIHLAANVTTPFADQHPHLFEQVNNWGTAEVVHAVEASKVDHFIYLSSVSVYGTSSNEVSETDPLNPRTFYGISKMRGEEHVGRLMDKLKQVHIIRCGNVYGYNRSMRFDAVINRFMFEANYSKRITINGTGEQSRPFIHIDKVCATIRHLLKRKLSSGTYNLVDQNLAVGQIVESLRKLYPELEMLFVNQHMKMRELKARPNPEINTAFRDMEQTFEEELRAFKSHFTF